MDYTLTQCLMGCNSCCRIWDDLQRSTLRLAILRDRWRIYIRSKRSFDAPTLFHRTLNVYCRDSDWHYQCFLVTPLRYASPGIYGSFYYSNDSWKICLRNDDKPCLNEQRWCHRHFAFKFYSKRTTRG